MNDKQLPPPRDALVSVTVRGARASGEAITRREAMQWVLGAVAASALPIATADAVAQEVGRTVTPQENAATQPAPTPATRGYGMDPSLVKVYKPGDAWPLLMTPAQRETAAALADVILPADEYGPAASEVGVPAMVEEWVSAPYPQQVADRPVLLDGLAWVEAESMRRFTKRFATLDAAQRRAICDDVCDPAAAKPEFRTAAKFFARFRALCAGAYYATPAGWKAIGYVGNVALPSFDGPPEEVLRRLGVTQTVG